MFICNAPVTKQCELVRVKKSQRCSVAGKPVVQPHTRLLYPPISSMAITRKWALHLLSVRSTAHYFSTAY